MYLSTDLITSVKRRCNVPTSQVTFTSTDFLALADEEVRCKLVPLVLKHMEEFYVTILDQSITANQSAYAIPTRAIGMALRDVQIVSSVDTDTRVPLERLSPEDLYAGITGNVRYLIKKNGFYLQGNSVVLYPTPSAATLDLLRMSYYMRPNQLVAVDTCGLIQSINTTLNTVTVVTLPSNITTNTLVDLVKAQPGFECTAIDQTITNIASTTLTFASLPSGLAVGDYVCQAQQSCVVQVPAELQPLLFQYVVVRVLSAQGDNTNLKAAVAELDSLEKSAGLLLAPRVSGKVKRVVNTRGISRWV